MENLDSLEEAQQMIESLIPNEEMRQLCLNMFMDAVEIANFYDPEGWYIEPAFDGHIWLITGSLVTCSLVEDGIWFSLDRKLMASQVGLSLVYDSNLGGWGWQPVDLDDPTWVHVATVINGFYTPSHEHDRIWPHVRRLMFETIYQCIMTPSSPGYRMPKVHSPGMLAYLLQVLDRESL